MANHARIDGTPVGVGDADVSDLTWVWARRWTLVGGIALVLTFLLPEYRGGALVWWWTWLSDAPRAEVIERLTLPALGILALVLRSRASLRVLGVVLTIAAAATVVVQYGLPPWKGQVLLPGVASLIVVPMVALLLIMFGGPVLVAGNRLRKLHPRRALPRLLAFLGAGLLLTVLLVPIMGDPGEPVARLLVDGRAWRSDWALEIALVAMIAFGVIGAIPPSRTHPDGLPTVVSILARGVAVAIPLALVVTAYVSADGQWANPRSFASWLPALMVVGWCASDLGMLVLLATGLVVWFDSVGGSQSAPTPLAV